jgi:hypothetical protein
MLEVPESQTDITMALERTSDLGNWSSGLASVKTIEVKSPTRVCFYRFKMTGNALL